MVPFRILKKNKQSEKKKTDSFFQEIPKRNDNNEART